MPPRAFTLRTPSHPLVQAVYCVVGGIVLIGAMLMGAVILSIALGVGLILGAAVLARSWWLGRKASPGRPRRPAAGALLEAEYTVLDERDERDSRGR
jgi:hypothetical protein